ncbi:MAG: aspartate aminotransferase family protein [Polyangia bacterium]
MSSDPKHEQWQLIEEAQTLFTQNYRQQPIVLRRGAGCKVWDVAGRRYLDLTGGIAATPLGHSHLGLAAAISEQAMKLLHVSNLYWNEQQILCARALAKRAHAMGPVRVFFCNSGAEANEAAVKLAKRYQTTIKGQAERVEVISFDGSFHGRTVATVALTGQEKYRAGFGPLIEWARQVPYPTDENDFRALDAITNKTCAVIIEPIQAEGGIRVAPPDFFKALRQKCTDTGTVLIFDEVQTGVGRTGTFFGYEQEGVTPDVMSLAKGLAGGVPIGCMVATEELSKGFAPGSHASTFGGNPLACAAAATVMETIEKEKLLARVIEASGRLHKGLEALVRKYPDKAKEVRGRGLLMGLAVEGDATPYVARAREQGVLLSVAGGTVVRFVPAFVVTDEEIDEGVAALDKALAG